MPIPKHIHQIWIQGFKELPLELKQKHKLLKKHNPNYRVTLWDEPKIKKLLKKYPKMDYFYNNLENFTGMVKIYQSKSDIARLVILYEHGGFYIDIDYYCPISLDRLYDKTDELVVVGSEYQILEYIPLPYHPKYGASFIGVKRKHSMFNDLFSQLVEQTDRDVIGVFFDNFLQKNNYKIRIIDSEYVSPHTCCEPGLCFTPTKSSSFFGRDILIYINCKRYIILFIVIIVIITFLLYYYF